MKSSLTATARANQLLGAEHVKQLSRRPEELTRLPIGAFDTGGMRGLVLRRLLLSLRCPALPVAAAANMLSRGGRSDDWDRFANDFAYWRGIRRAAPSHDTWGSLIHPPIILMYHAIARRGEPAGRYVIPESMFARQMAWLKHMRYRVLGLDEFLHAHRCGQLPPARSVIITFDDGYADNADLAFPVLKQLNLPATVFIVSGRVGGENDWDRSGELAGRALLGWTDLEMLRGSDISIAAHGASHRLLEGLTPGSLLDEVESSKACLERELGLPVSAFAYPGGRYDRNAQTAVERAGFAGACCSEPGANGLGAPAYALRRIEVRGTDSLADFALAVWLGKNRVLSRLWKAQ